MKLISVGLIVFISRSSAIGEPVAGRFDYDRINSRILRVAIPASNSQRDVAKHLEGLVHGAFKRTNHTITLVDALEMGQPSASGNYTAFLGELVNKRADIAILGTLLSSFNYDGIKIGVPISGVVLKVYSQLGWQPPENIDLIRSIERMSSLAFVFILVVIHVIAAAYCIMKFRSVIPRYIQLSWHSLRCVLGQGNFSAKSKIEQSLYSLITVLAFVLIFGYMLNIMSTDAMVTRPTRHIESLLDLLDSHFEKVFVAMPQSDFFYDYARASPPDTPMGRVYEQMKAKSDCRRLATCSFFTMKYGEDISEGVQALKDASVNGNAAMFFTQEVADHVLLPFTCQTDPEMVEKLFTAPQEIAYDILMSFHGRHLDDAAERYSRYRFSNLFEFALTWRWASEVIDLFTAKMTANGKDMTYYKCMATDTTVEESTLVPVGLGVYKKPVLILSLFVSATALILILELPWKRLARGTVLKRVRIVWKTLRKLTRWRHKCRKQRPKPVAPPAGRLSARHVVRMVGAVKVCLKLRLNDFRAQPTG
ncbi:hypothetical protein HDE_13058 [Halotydeus destructor]|nr:hypothetical protein HDE_13058 [Halotydeus destructor]